MGDDDQATKPNQVRFRLMKSNYFRVIHVDGAWGGIGPRGHIQFALYNERRAIPRVTVRDVTDGPTVPERIIEEEEGFVRELEIEVIMDLQTAMSFHSWLGDKIQSLSTLLKQAEDKQ